MTDSLKRLRELTESLPDLEALETNIGGPAVLFDDAQGITSMGLGAYRDSDIAMMRTYAAAGALLPTHVHGNEHEWFGVIRGKVEIIFEATNETAILESLDSIHIDAGRPHSIKALEDTYAWSITIPPAPGYPTVQSCPMAANFAIATAT